MAESKSVIPTCQCSAYGDLPIDKTAIDERVRAFPKVRKDLRQVAHKLVERWSTHYRLYVCDACGQRWQASLAKSSVGEWIAFKVPTISLKDWKDQQFVCPDDIVGYLASRSRYFQQIFDTSSDKCNVDGCDEFAIVHSVKCKQHQFENLVKVGTLWLLPSGRWFGPYSPALIDVKQDDQHADSKPKRANGS